MVSSHFIAVVLCAFICTSASAEEAAAISAELKTTEGAVDDVVENLVGGGLMQLLGILGPVLNQLQTLSPESFLSILRTSIPTIDPPAVTDQGIESILPNFTPRSIITAPLQLPLQFFPSLRGLLPNDNVQLSTDEASHVVSPPSSPKRNTFHHHHHGFYPGGYYPNYGYGDGYFDHDVPFPISNGPWDSSYPPNFGRYYDRYTPDYWW